MHAAPVSSASPLSSEALRLVSHRASMGEYESLYRRLFTSPATDATRSDAAAFIGRCLQEVADQPADLPSSPRALQDWMEASTLDTFERYAAYLREREAGQPRRFFGTRAHALHFLRMVAPTKRVDGAWLWGLVAHAGNPRLSPLVRTYLDELGGGDPGQNHVLLYRRLLDGLGLEQEHAERDDAWKQGAIQLALGHLAQSHLPEVVGFNLGYEQLPLHLLITAFELDELGIDPYYFTLHVTVDNAASGHARQACDAALALLPRHGDADAFWQRMREGSKLGCLGLGTLDAIRGFDIDAEALRILTAKARLGAGAHASHCRLAGRSINDWLREPHGMAGFVAEMERAGWIRRGEPPAASRFWQLLQGERAQMFGVFTPYELQVLHDWIRGAEAADGQPYDEPASTNQGARRPRFRALQARRQRASVGLLRPAVGDALDPDVDALRARLAEAGPAQRQALLLQALGPAEHWMPAGLWATRLLADELRA